MCSNQHAPDLLIKPLQNYSRTEFWLLLPSTVNASTLHTNPWTLLCFTNYNHQTKVRIKQHSNANTCKFRHLNRPRQALLFLPFNFLQQRPAYCSGTEYVFSIKITRIMPRKKPAVNFFNDFLPYHCLLAWKLKIIKGLVKHWPLHKKIYFPINDKL